MMKCKYCGGNLTLEQAYCPHCGRPNEEAAQHVKDMEHYQDFVQNRLGVIDAIGSLHSIFVLKEIKHTTAIPLSQAF